MAKHPISRIHQLSAALEEHLHQFAGDSDYDNYMAGEERKRKRMNPYAQAALAGTAVGAGTALAANRNKLKAGVQGALPALRTAGKRAAFKGMDAGHDLLYKGASAAGRAGKFVEGKGLLRTAKIGDQLKQVGEAAAKKIRKKSLTFLSRGDLAAIVRIEDKFRRAGV